VTDSGHPPDGYLVRQVVDSTVIDPQAPGGPGIDLGLRAVGYWWIPDAPGLVTGEPADIQGLRRGPHLATATDAHLVERPAVLRIRIPAPGVLRLTLVGGRSWQPADDGLRWGMIVDDRPAPAAYTVERPTTAAAEGRYTIRTEGGGIVVDTKPFRFRILGPDGDALCDSGGDLRQAMGAPLAPAMAFGPTGSSCALTIRPGELLAGLGEQPGPATRNGQRVQVAVDDAMGTGTGRTYKAAPVLHSSARYSLFLHSPGPLHVDAGAQFSDILSWQTTGNLVDLFVFTAARLGERLRRYTDITGKAGAVPRWALGVWMSRCRYRDRHELLGAAQGMRRHRIGCDVMHLDPSWLERDVLNCDFVWSTARFGNPSDLVAELAALGLRLSLWELPYLDPASPIAAEGRAAGFLVRTADGTPAAVARTFSRDGRPRWLVDFTNPQARQWWTTKHHPLLDAGVSAFATDFGEGFPDHAHNGEEDTGGAWRNLYPLWYNRTVSEAVGSHLGRPAVVLGRSGWAGSQRYPAQWSGDAESTALGMAATLRAGLSWSLSAPGLWTHDIGGFFGGDPDTGPTPALYVRWAQFGCLSPMTRFHGLTPREPWRFGDDALAIVRQFVDLRYRLLPYLQSAALATTSTGLPVLRPMALEMEDDPAAWHCAEQYLLGGDIIVVPVPSEDPGPVEVSVLVPPGTWIDLFTGAAVTGPGRTTVTVPLDRIPLLVRAGATIPFGPPAQSTAEADPASWTLHYWPGPPRTTTVLDPDGTCRYRPLDQAGHPPSDPEAVTALGVDEPGARATDAVCHLIGGGTRPLFLAGW